MRILLIDDERNIARMLSVALEADGHEIVAVESGSGAMRQVQKSPFDVAFLDLRLGQEDGLEVLTQLRQVDRGLAVVIITAHASIPTAIEATRLGAMDYLSKPFTPEQIRLVLTRIEKNRALERRVEESESQFENPADESHLVAEDSSMRNVLDLAHKSAASQASIILLGKAARARACWPARSTNAACGGIGHSSR